MMRRLFIVALVLLAGCGGTPEQQVATPEPRAGGADSPELAVTSVLKGIGESDAALLESMTLTEQLALVALVEGATASEAEAALGFASEQVAAQFWSSFASGVEDFLGANVDGIRIGEVVTVDVPGARYARVEVMFTLDSADRSSVVTDRNGWRVDLIATFPGAFLPSIDVALERASSPGAGPAVTEAILDQSTSLDALDVIGVPAELADALVSAREAISSRR